jgi:Fe-Mn family superoxide dismutase
MAIELPPLPYDMNALEPVLSKETLEYHYGKHHRAYVDNLNKLIINTPFEKMTLEEIVRKSEGAIFNNAAQVWNHTFYWNSLSPTGGGSPEGKLKKAMETAFGDIATFKTQFALAAVGRFGSGWAWLTRDPAGKLAITTTANAGNPLTDGHTPLLTCDVWEHAYYIDYRNARPAYLESFWKKVNWAFARDNLKA